MDPEAPESRLARALNRGGGPLAVAESCTGGLVAHRITRIPGCSSFFDRGLVVYSNRAKIDELGVPPGLIETEGAVSEACARAMLRGLFERTPARIGLSVTGIAGPAGGSPEKPVGTVWLAWGRPDHLRTECLQIGGGRNEIQETSAGEALERLAALAETQP